jgi:hypothetical protein
MSKLEIVFAYTKKIEKYLENEFKAEGRGLHTKVNSIEYRLPLALIKKIRWIATMRNNMAHTEGFELENLEDFKATCESVLTELEVLNNEGLRLVGEKSVATKNGLKAMTTQTAGWKKSNQGFYRNRHATKSMGVNDRWARFAVLLLLVCIGFAILMWKGYSFGWKGFNKWVKSNEVLAIDRDSEPDDFKTTDKARKTVDINQAIRDIDNGVFKYIATNTKIWLDNEKLIEKGNGTYDVQVMLHWDIPEKPVLNVLNKYFVNEASDMLTVNRVDFGNDRNGFSYGVIIPGSLNQKNSVSRELFQHLISQQAIIKVFVGKRSTPVTIASGRQCLVTCKGSGDDQFQIHFSNRNDPQNIMFGFGKGEQNPVIIKGVTIAEFKSVKMITTLVEVNSL